MQPDEFGSIIDFVDKMEKLYNVSISRIHVGTKDSFRHILSSYISVNGIRCTIEGSRFSDPNARGLKVFTSSSGTWPPFLRVSPILQWNYRLVWKFLIEFNLPYCTLYDEGYTSLGNKTNTKKNPFLKINNKFRPAYELENGEHERAGRF